MIAEVVMADIDDEILFAEEEPTPKPLINRKPWKIMIVDDEPEIHTITRLALAGFEFDGRELEFISAYSGKEACELIVKHPDTAMMLLDVMMETDDAGLEVVKFIREVQYNRLVRIVLRTGQAGQFPEHKVVLEYDINDYKTKTELTAQKLFTVVVSSLRTYIDIEIIMRNKRGLEKIVGASVSIFRMQSIEQFVQGVLMQITSIMRLGMNSFCGSGVLASGASVVNDKEFCIVAGTGAYERLAMTPISYLLPEDVREDVKRTIIARSSLFLDDRIIMYFCGTQRSNVIYLECKRKLDSSDHDLLNIFCSNVAVVFDNITLTDELEKTKKEIVERIGAIAETRSQESSKHVRRVAEYCYLLAKALGIEENEALMIKEAAPMHDIGKVAISDSILNKPSKLTDDEFREMKAHAKFGRDVLGGSGSKLLDMAAVIAYEHHERFDGKGYPRGLKAHEIHIYARIAAIADVFDVLGTKRCYKEAWSLDKCFEYLREQRGTQFDPKLVDLFLKQKEKAVEIHHKFAD
ncbi:phosphodiesterase [Campylobacterota bacterium]|nr:phosphodiesterase [Campylobacterota bacterium]